MTSLAEEWAEQARWQVLPGRPPATWAEDLLRNEFLDPAEQRARLQQRLRETLGYASTVVPYWRQRFRRLKIRDVEAPDAILGLPPLTRADLQDNAAALRRPGIPPEERGLITKSSGTTAEPITVLQSRESLGMFSRLKQREHRWFRFDPAGRLGAIRPAPDLPRMRDGSTLPARTVVRVDGWPYVGSTFRTGSFVGFSNINVIDDQMGFLRGEAPDYLIMQASGLEHVALASGGVPGLKACLATSQTLTPPMRATVERKLGVPVHQNYGFNEIGIAASRCSEGGWYHVHAEHCVVEIVDPEGRPVRPGERGKILVTCLTNRAMPLIRYDCDDYATAVEGPCRCGRTLPAFGQIHGRYRRIALLPPGSWQRWGAIQLALYELPRDLHATLRRYQAHEYADGTWVLRIHAVGDRFDAIAAWVRPRFDAAAPNPPSLRIVATEEFEGRPDAKFQDFYSDFVPAIDAPEAP